MSPIVRTRRSLLAVQPPGRHAKTARESSAAGGAPVAFVLLLALALAAPAEAAAGGPAARLLEPTLGAESAGSSARDGPVWFHLRPPFADPQWTPRATGPAEKSSWLALGEVVGINLGMWFVSYWMGNDYSKISFDTIEQNFRKGWIVDTDAYWTNQLGHPYEGQAFYTAARSTGHGFYESFGFSFFGSVVWEQLMETQSPSVNDQVMTPGGGTVLGEVLWRMHRLVLDSAGPDPSFWRELGAFAVSPVAGVNRFLFGDRYEGPALLPPSWRGEFRFGTLIGGSAEDLRTGARASDVGPWASIAAQITYGVPGTPDLPLRRPFDHFEAQGSFAFTNAEKKTATLLLRGLVVGEALGPATHWGGLWGLFTSYDLISVPVFSASGFGVGPGASLMKRWGWFELHGTALVELLPWASGGAQETLFARDYHVGPGASALVALRGFLGDRATLDLEGREYLISGAYARGQQEDIAWSRATLTVRVLGPHAVSASVDWTRRHASYPYDPDVQQRAAVFSAHYALLDGW
jgi:hypothetical protein